MNLRDHLQSIHDKRGTLTASLVVEEATDPTHPLHARFEWDDSVAGHNWRLEQASQLLRVTYRPNADKPQDIRAFVAVRQEDSPKSEYVPTTEAFADPFVRKLVLQSMAREWITLRTRYEHMAEFAEMVRRDIEDQSAVAS